MFESRNSFYRNVQCPRTKQKEMKCGLLNCPFSHSKKRAVFQNAGELNNSVVTCKRTNGALEMSTKRRNTGQSGSSPRIDPDNLDFHEHKSKELDPATILADFKNDPPLSDFTSKRERIPSRKNPKPNVVKEQSSAFVHNATNELLEEQRLGSSSATEKSSKRATVSSEFTHDDFDMESPIPADNIGLIKSVDCAAIAPKTFDCVSTIDDSERVYYIKRISSIFASLKKSSPTRDAIDYEYLVLKKSNDNTYYDHIKSFIDVLQNNGNYKSFTETLKDTSLNSCNISKTFPDISSSVACPMIENTQKSTTGFSASKTSQSNLKQTYERPLLACLGSTKNVTMSVKDVGENISESGVKVASQIQSISSKLASRTDHQKGIKNPSQSIYGHDESENLTGKNCQSNSHYVSNETKDYIPLINDNRVATKKECTGGPLPFVKMANTSRDMASITPKLVDGFDVPQDIRIILIEKIVNAYRKTNTEKPITAACSLEFSLAKNFKEATMYSKKVGEALSQIDPSINIKDKPMAVPKSINPNPPAELRVRKSFIQQLAAAYKKKRPDIFTPFIVATEKEFEIASTSSSNTYPQAIKKLIFAILKGKSVDAKPILRSHNTDEHLLEKLNKLVIPVSVLKKNSYFVEIPESEQQENYDSSTRDCIRCGTKFRLQDQLKKTQCSFHPGKRLLLNKFNAQDNNQKIYDCCGSTVTDNSGCSECPYHVFKWNRGFELQNVIPFQKTSSRPENPNAYKAVGIDCEMGFTTKGFEVMRVTVVDFFTREEVFDTIVQPFGEVLDFNTTYSGISEIGVNALPFYDMIEILFSIIDRNTILVGHGFENDLNVLRLIHERIVDTSILYPKNQVLVNRKWSLRDLTFKFLSRKIQTGEHNSTEDALAAIDIIRFHLINNI